MTQNENKSFKLLWKKNQTKIRYVSKANGEYEINLETFSKCDIIPNGFVIYVTFNMGLFLRAYKNAGTSY